MAQTTSTKPTMMIPTPQMPNSSKSNALAPNAMGTSENQYGPLSGTAGRGAARGATCFRRPERLGSGPASRALDNGSGPAALIGRRRRNLFWVSQGVEIVGAGLPLRSQQRLSVRHTTGRYVSGVGVFRLARS